MGGVGDCTMKAPPDAFEPDMQWSWNGPGAEKESLVTPLVANLTDDNNDGVIDLCDTPDIIVTVTAFPAPGHIYVLDGATGSLHFMIPTAVTWSINPAIGDIDDDGIPEIIAAVGEGFGGPSSAIAFEHDGTVKWQSAAAVMHSQGGAITLADLDNDGDVEISMDKLILDHLGNTVATLPEAGFADNFTTVAADLDGDGDLEVVIGANAYHHDGTTLLHQPRPRPRLRPGRQPRRRPRARDHDQQLRRPHPARAHRRHQVPDISPRRRPLVVSPRHRPRLRRRRRLRGRHQRVQQLRHVRGRRHRQLDRQGPGRQRLGRRHRLRLRRQRRRRGHVRRRDQPLRLRRQRPAPALVPRSAKTLAEYPVVADVDNDGSAEIVVVSDSGFQQQPNRPTVQVIRDIEDRWIQPRRIWNQHTYHVTNVREDGKIPQFEKPWWQKLNTFRTNSQIEGGEICLPPPQ
jgi:hypothetical protein